MKQRVTILLLIMILGVVGQGTIGIAKEKATTLKQLSTAERFEAVARDIESLKKSLQDDPNHEDLKQAIITGNQITVLVTNQGSISTPSADNANADLVWPAGPTGLGYAFEFGPMIGAEVVNGDGDTLQIISDGFIRRADGDFEPGTTNKWGWEPRPRLVLSSGNGK